MKLPIAFIGLFTSFLYTGEICEYSIEMSLWI